jgi:hypothetical protein
MTNGWPVIARYPANLSKRLRDQPVDPSLLMAAQGDYDEHLNRGLCRHYLEPELLLNRGVEPGLSIRVITPENDSNEILTP